MLESNTVKRRVLDGSNIGTLDAVVKGRDTAHDFVQTLAQDLPRHVHLIHEIYDRGERSQAQAQTHAQTQTHAHARAQMQKDTGPHLPHNNKSWVREEKKGLIHTHTHIGQKWKHPSPALHTTHPILSLKPDPKLKLKPTKKDLGGLTLA